jgi:hypothetical protein
LRIRFFDSLLGARNEKRFQDLSVVNVSPLLINLSTLPTHSDLLGGGDGNPVRRQGELWTWQIEI